MIVDASALIAVAFREPEYEQVLEKLIGADHLGMGMPTAVEAGIVVSARLSGEGGPLLTRLLQEFAIDLVPFGESHCQAALDAYVRYGRGRHLAALNFGDCLCYAVAALAKEPLLCVGEDFRRTDLRLA